MLLIMSHMKKVTLREFKHESRYQRMAHDGQPVLVTYRGKPYFVALPPEKAPGFVGAARRNAAYAETVGFGAAWDRVGS